MITRKNAVWWASAAVVAAFVLLLGYLLSIQLHQARHRRWGAQFFHRDRQVRAEARASVATRRRSRPL